MRVAAHNTKSFTIIDASIEVNINSRADYTLTISFRLFSDASGVPIPIKTKEAVGCRRDVFP